MKINLSLINPSVDAVNGEIKYTLPWIPNADTLALVKHFESLHDGDLKKIGLQPKLCPAGVWTEGWGRAMIDPRNGRHLKGVANKDRAYQLTTIKDEKEAEVALWEDMWKLGAQRVIKQIGQKNWNRLSHIQQGAIASFTYNCGTGNPPYKMWENVVLWLDKKMTDKQFQDYWDASIIRALNPKTGNREILAGLVRRRKSESRLFFDQKPHIVKK